MSILWAVAFAVAVAVSADLAIGAYMATKQVAVGLVALVCAFLMLVVTAVVLVSLFYSAAKLPENEDAPAYAMVMMSCLMAAYMYWPQRR
jgi:hypothetical protein